MIGQIRKIVFFAALPVLATFTPVSAATTNDCSWGCAPSTCQENDCGNFWLRGDLLWWKARGSNINYYSDFATAEYTTLDKSATENKIKRKSVNYNRDAGFRIGLGYKKACSCYDALFNWTRFCTSAKGRPDTCKVIDPCYEVTKYKTDTDWRLNLNFWDFEFGKTCMADECFFVRLSAGVRGTRISQHYDSKDAFIADSVVFGKQLISVSDVRDFLKFHEKHTFHGAGPRVGLNGEWLMGNCGFSLYGEAAAAFLVGYTDHDVCNRIFVSYIEQAAVTAKASFEFEPVVEFSFERDECLQGNRVITDLAGGIRWRPSRCLCGCPWRFQIGWENHTIFGQKEVFFGEDLSLFDIKLNPDRAIELPLHRGACKSSLAVFGVVFSAAVEY